MFLYLLLSAMLFRFVFVRKETHDLNDMSAPENEYLKAYHPIILDGLAFMEQHAPQFCTTRSFDGLTLAAEYFDRGSDCTVLLFHGYRSASRRDFSCAVRAYYEMGLNVLLVQQRSHGKSEGKLITFGVKERRDVATWIDYILQRGGREQRLLLGGMSMGASTVLMAAGLALPEQVKGVIADCGYTSPVAILNAVAHKAFHFSALPFIPAMELYCRLFGGFGICGVSAVKALQKTKLPVLLIHGTADGFVPYRMSEENYAAIAGEKQLVSVEGADHGLSYLVDTNAVEGAIQAFVTRMVSPHS